MHFLKLKPIGLVLLLLPVAAQGQDSQFWTQQYGTRSTLLGGMVVGTVSDLSAAYYNPGALSLLEDPGFIMSANIGQMERVNLVLLDSDRDLGTTKFNLAPDMFAGVVGIDLFGGERLAYSILVRQAFDFDINARRVGTREIPPGTDPVETANEATLQQSINETWVGVTWSRRLTDTSGIGITPFVAVRSQRTRKSFGYAGAEEGDVVTASRVSEFSYTCFNVLAKIGYKTRLGPFGLGITATSPGLNVYGFGDVYDASSIAGTTDIEPLLEAAHHPDQDATYKSPFSTAVGAGYDMGDATFHTTLEYFAGVQGYKVIDAPVTFGQTTGRELDPDVTHAGQAILNWGVAGEYRTTSKVTLYAAIIRDLSTDTDEKLGGQDVSIAAWDLWHTSLGGSFSMGSIDIILGAAVAFGNEVRDMFTEIDPIPDTPVSIKYRRYRIQFGFSADL